MRSIHWKTARSVLLGGIGVAVVSLGGIMSTLVGLGAINFRFPGV